MPLQHVSRIVINPRVSLNIRRKIARDVRACNVWSARSIGPRISASCSSVKY